MKRFFAAIVATVLSCAPCAGAAADGHGAQLTGCHDAAEAERRLCNETFMVAAGLDDYYTLYTEAFSESERLTVALETLNLVKHGAELTEAFDAAVLGVIVPDTTRGKVIAYSGFDNVYEPEYSENREAGIMEIRYIHSSGDGAGSMLSRGWNRIVTVHGADGISTIVNGQKVDGEVELNNIIADNAGVSTGPMTIIQYNTPVLSNISITWNNEAKMFSIHADYQDPSMQDPMYTVKWYNGSELIAVTDSLEYILPASFAGKKLTSVISASNIYGLTSNETAVEAEIPIGYDTKKPIIFGLRSDDTGLITDIERNPYADHDFSQYTVFISLYGGDQCLKRLCMLERGDLEDPVSVTFNRAETDVNGYIKCMVWNKEKMQPLTDCTVFNISSVTKKDW